MRLNQVVQYGLHAPQHLLGTCAHTRGVALAGPNHRAMQEANLQGPCSALCADSRVSSAPVRAATPPEKTKSPRPLFAALGDSFDEFLLIKSPCTWHAWRSSLTPPQQRLV